MPGPMSAPLIATERTGLHLSRAGTPVDLPSAQAELVRRGFEKLVRHGLEDDGFDVYGADPVHVRMTRTGPGDYELVAAMRDARPLRRRLMAPRGARGVEDATQHLHNAAETVLSGVEMLPVIVASSSVTLGTMPDGTGLVPMVVDGCYVMRVPWSIFRIMGASPDARAGAEDLKHVFAQDSGTITLIRGMDSDRRRSESIIEVPSGLWEAISDRGVVPLFESVDTGADPLSSLMTRQERGDSARRLQGDVGPRGPGRRGDPPMEPPGPRL